VEWKDRTHFFRTAATAMRRILVDRARAKLMKKRMEVSRSPSTIPPNRLPDSQIIALDEALDTLAVEKPITPSSWNSASSSA